MKFKALPHIRESSKRASSMEKARLSGLKITSRKIIKTIKRTRVSLKMENLMAKELFSLQMGKLLRVHLQKV